MSIFRKIVISCEQATYLYEKKREGKLDAMERFGLNFHLLYCRFCALFFKQVALLEKSIKNLSAKTGSQAGFNQLRKAQLQKALDEQLKK